MRRLIVLEGPDGAGKTELAKTLQKTYGFVYHHEGPPKTSHLLQHYAGLLNDAHKSDLAVVFDRLHLGELVYGPLLRGHDLIGYDGLTLLLRLFRGYDVLTIFCNPGKDTCFKNWRARYGDELVKDPSIFNAIFDSYLHLQQLVYRSCPYVTWNYLCDNLDTIFGNIETPSVTQINGVIGSVKAPFLFIGEKANHHALDLPFFAKNGSSEFLNHCLEEAGFEERNIAMMNACTIQSDDHPIKKVVEQNQPKVVIPLGNVAWSKYVQANTGVEHQKMHHPQYVKRFLGKEGRDEYVRKFRAIRKSVIL